MTSIDDDALNRVSSGSHHSPHDVLGLHPDESGGWVIRARRPLAASVTAVFRDGTRAPLAHVAYGVWEGSYAGEPAAYQLAATYDDAPDFVIDDAYRHLPTIGELDLHLIAEGRHEELWRVLGAHAREDDGVAGTSFSVWAPNAQAVRVVGDFNGRDPGRPSR